DTEHAYQQYVSGWMFSTFDVQPALGRLLTEDDDLTPGAHPYAVLSHDYWTRRFGRDPHVIGRTFRAGGLCSEVVRGGSASMISRKRPMIASRLRSTRKSDFGAKPRSY